MASGKDRKLLKAMSNTNKTAETVKDRQPSTTYTIRQFGEMIKKLEKLKMTTKEETAKLREIQKTVVTRWIGGELM